ncbi:MAG: type I glutamate--ammonia ligase [Gallionella sp.]|nr:MAG: type I glutamate--ammonia ligase [Gallionella sp.]
MPKDKVFELIKREQVKMVDLRFVDLTGRWQHFTVPVTELTEETFSAGSGFDGSSIKGFKPIEESDMLLMPDPTTAFVDPFFAEKTLCLICDVYEPGTKVAPFIFDPRSIARRAEEYLHKSGLADTAYFGPEAEFFIFDTLRYHQGAQEGYYHIDADEGEWNTGDAESNLAYKIRHKEGYFPVPPHDTQQDIRSEMVSHMIACGLSVEKHHHEVATAGQAEIDLRYAPLLKMADAIMLYKYLVKSTARKHGKVATFMPKPIFGDNGSGMHTHVSLWKDGKPLFAGDRYAGLSEMALHFAAGLLHHAPSILAFAAPTTNSYKRLVPGYEAPVNLVYSKRNRSAAIRIPAYSEAPAAKRLEFRPPDPSCNPYLTFSAMVLAGLDGIAKRLDPGKPLDENTYHLPAEQAAKIKSVPGSLVESLAALERDHEFLTAGGVFPKDFISQWIALKREDITEVGLRPHPYEFALYHDC